MDEVWAVYEADGTLNSLWVSADAASKLCHDHPGWSWGSYQPVSLQEEIDRS